MAQASADYDMSNGSRHLLIISNENFVTEKDNLPNRKGTKIDEDRLKKTFEGFEFKVTIKNNLTAEDMLKEIEEVAKSNAQTNTDCVAIAILTHPVPDEEECVYGTDWESVKIEKLIEPLKNQSGLVGKPKILLIQAGPSARKGPCEVEGVLNETDDAGGIPSTKPQPQIKIIPEMADILYYVSCELPTGYNGIWEFDQKGSILIQKLCDVLDGSKEREKTEGKIEFCTLLQNAGTEISEVDDNAPMPIINSLLTGSMFLSSWQCSKRKSSPCEDENPGNLPKHH